MICQWRKLYNDQDGEIEIVPPLAYFASRVNYSMIRHLYRVDNAHLGWEILSVGCFDILSQGLPHNFEKCKRIYATLPPLNTPCKRIHATPPPLNTP